MPAVARRHRQRKGVGICPKSADCQGSSIRCGACQKPRARATTRQNAIDELCSHWADTDGPAALAWAQSLPSGAEQIAAINKVISNWALKDPQAALQSTNQYPVLTGDVFAEIAKAWSRSDLNAATNWVGSLPDGEKKDAALLSLASSTEERAPKLAAQFCTLLTTSQPPKEVIQDIASSLAREDLSSAVEWACNLKDDATSQAALSALSESWAQNDPKGMATYALGLPAGDAQAQYLTAACRQLAVRDLPGMVESLKQLSDAQLRRSILEQAGRDCDLSQIDQAAKYVAAMPADDDQKAAIKGLLSTWIPARHRQAAVIAGLRSFSENNPQTAFKFSPSSKHGLKPNRERWPNGWRICQRELQTMEWTVHFSKELLINILNSQRSGPNP